MDEVEERQIDNDIGRTFGISEERRKQAIRSILVKFCSVYRGSYTQGMSLVVCALLAVTEDGALTFELLRHVHNKLLPNYYCHTMHGVKVDVGIFIALIRAHIPELENVSDARFSLLWSRWAIALFCDSLPSFWCFQLWDVLFQHGAKMLFSFALAVLQEFQSTVRDGEDDVSVCVALDENLMSLKLDFENLLDCAFSICESAMLCNERLALQRIAGPVVQSRVTFAKRRASPLSAPVSSSSSPTGLFGSIASFLSRTSSPTSSPPNTISGRQCAFCLTEEGEIGLYKWASLGEVEIAKKGKCRTKS